jgi:electron-transferring-flavoprotein dehydrogenase
VPKVHFAGGALIGGAAGLRNAASYQGTHLAMKSGMLAADSIFGELTREGAPTAGPLHMEAYGRSFTDSWVTNELQQVRCHQAQAKDSTPSSSTVFTLAL